MPKITLDIPEDKIPLLLEITEAMGLSNEDILVKEGIPDWHRHVLQERLENYKTGKTKLTNWEDFLEELDKEDEL